MDANLTKLLLDGTSTIGKKIISQHASAVASIANCVRSTLGPFGMQKLMIDETGEAIISNDGNCILQQLQVDNPIASLVIDLASQQDQEIGDGTTSIILLVSELLRSVETLFEQNISCNDVIRGFKTACRQACKYLTANQSFSLDDADYGTSDELLMNLAKTSISSKIISDNADHFAKIAIDAVKSSKLSSKSEIYMVDSVSMLKSVGRSIDDSTFINAFGLNCVKASKDMPFKVENAKIACIDFALNKGKMKFGVQVIVNNPDQLKEIRQKEYEIGKKLVDIIVDSGANVILSTNTIDDSYVRFLAKLGIMAVKFVAKKDLKRIATATGATMVSVLNLDPSTKQNLFPATLLGNAGEIAQEFVGDNEAILIREPRAFNAGCIFLRGPNESIIEEVDRSLHDCMFAVKRALESKKLVAGGGSCETAMAVNLEEFALSIPTKDQLVISEFANALKIIPKQLSMNSGCDTSEILGNLFAAHYRSMKEEPNRPCFIGLDLVNRSLLDCKKAGIIDPLVSKVKSLKKATEAVIILAKIDNVIKNNPNKNTGDNDGHDDEDY